MKKGYAIALSLSEVYVQLGGKKTSHLGDADPEILKQAESYVDDGAQYLSLAILNTNCADDGTFLNYIDESFFASRNNTPNKAIPYTPTPDNEHNQTILTNLLTVEKIGKINGKLAKIKNLAIEFCKTHGKYSANRAKLEKDYEFFDPS